MHPDNNKSDDAESQPALTRDFISQKSAVKFIDEILAMTDDEPEPIIRLFALLRERASTPEMSDAFTHLIEAAFNQSSARARMLDLYVRELLSSEPKARPSSEGQPSEAADRSFSARPENAVGCLWIKQHRDSREVEIPVPGDGDGPLLASFVRPNNTPRFDVTLQPMHNERGTQAVLNFWSDDEKENMEIKIDGVDR